jgi:hypothetical protein
MHPEKQEVRKIIESAFAGVPRPATSLRQFLLTDEKGMSGGITPEEWRLAAITRTDQSWNDISDLEIEHCGCQLAHMGAEEFPYYLPAYMLYSLDHAQDSILESMIPSFVIFGLTPSSDYPSHSAEQYSLLSSLQRKAIAVFLGYMAHYSDEHASQAAKGAITSWSGA